MGRKIAVVGNKGGTGKTFIATHIAYGLTKNGDKVLFIDCDYSQRSGMNWLLGRWDKVHEPKKIYEARKNLDAMWIKDKEEIADLPVILSKMKYDYYVLDGRPEREVTSLILSILNKDDIVILPIDISDDTIYQMKELDEGIKVMRRDLERYVIVNKMTDSRISQVLFHRIEEQGFLVLALFPLLKETVKKAEAESKLLWEMRGKGIIRITSYLRIVCNWLKL